MAQVMVNFRMDEDVKKNMELACKEMGLSMTAAFTIFATKVGREKRIPFEITAEPCGPPSRQARRRAEAVQGREEGPSMCTQRQERLEGLCAQVRQSLTAIHTAIPAAITGLAMERVRLLCGDELKDKASEASKAVKSLFSGRNAGLLEDKDLGVLDEYAGALASIAEDLRDVERTLIPAMKAWSGGEGGGFEDYAQRLAGLSRRFDELGAVLQRFLSSTARRSGAQVFQGRIQQAAKAIGTAYVQTALESLEGQVLCQYDLLDRQTQARLETDYLQTLELTLRELGAAERSGGDVGAKAALCLRTVNVLSQVITDSSRTRQEWDQRTLEAEVAALERLAAMRGDLSGGMRPEG